MNGHREMDRYLATDPDLEAFPPRVTNRNVMQCECPTGGFGPARCHWHATCEDSEGLQVCEWCQIGLCLPEPHGFHG